MKWQRHHKTYTYYITYRSQIWLNRTNITKNAWLISFKVPQHYICRVSYSLLPIRILDLSVWTSNEQDFVLPWHGNSPWPHQINTKLVAVHEIRTWNHSARNSASLSYQTGTREQHQGRPCPWWKLAAQLPRNPSWLQTGALTKQCDFRPSLTHDKTKNKTFHSNSEWPRSALLQKDWILSLLERSVQLVQEFADQHTEIFWHFRFLPSFAQEFC